MAPPLTLMISGIELKLLDHGQGLGGKGLVELDQADVALLQTGHLQHRRDRLDRADPHDLGRHPLDGEGDKACQRFQARLLEKLFGDHQRSRRAVGHLRTGRGRDRAVQLENRLELCQTLRGWCRHARRRRSQPSFCF